MTLKKLSLIYTLCFSTLYGNQTQAFTTTTIPIAIDKGSKVEKLFAGTYEEYGKQYDLIFENAKSNSKLQNIGILTAGSAGLYTGSYLIKAGGSMSNFNSNGGLVGLGIVLAAGAIAAGVEAATQANKKEEKRDSRYEYISILTNSHGEKTIVDTHIVSRDELTQNELDKYGFESQTQYISLKMEKK